MSANRCIRPGATRTHAAAALAASLALCACAPPGGPARDGQDTAAADASATVSQRFAPGVISTSGYEYSTAISADGRLLYFARQYEDDPAAGGLHLSRRSDGGWSAPVKIDSGGLRGAGDPFLSADGRHLYFIAERAKDNFDIAVMTRDGDGFSAPRFLDAPLNTDSHEYFVSLTDDGALFFSSNRGGGDFDLYRALPAGDGFAEPLNLGPAINSTAYDADPFVAPDGRYLVFTSNRAGGSGRGDLHVSFSDGRGGWTPPRNLGPRVNTAANELCPFVSRDGRFLYYTSAGDIRRIDAGVIKQARSPAGPDHGGGWILPTSSQWHFDGPNGAPGSP